MPGDERFMGNERSSFVSSLLLQSRTMSALSVRFMMTRYGRENIGFLWIILEPMILCVGVMGLFSFLKGGYEHGIQIVAFVFTGYMPLTLQRHVSSSGIFIMRMSKSTLIHHNVTYYDNFISRVLLEFIATSSAALIIYFILLILKIIEPAYDFGQMIIGWLLMGSLAAGIACLYAGLSESYEVADKFLPAFNYLMLPLSGFFFMVDWLPAQVQQYALYVPLVHAFEAIRAGMFGPSLVTNYSYIYALSCAAVMMCIGLCIINRVRDRV